MGGEDDIEPLLVGVEGGLEEVGELRADGFDESVVGGEGLFVQHRDGEGVQLGAGLEEGVEDGGAFGGGEGGDGADRWEGLHVWGNGLSNRGVFVNWSTSWSKTRVLLS